ncbi:hypothetical protein CTA1_6270, partial [Colletotrichum tanaceti]
GDPLAHRRGQPRHHLRLAAHLPRLPQPPCGAQDPRRGGLLPPRGRAWNDHHEQQQRETSDGSPTWCWDQMPSSMKGVLSDAVTTYSRGRFTRS